jgi:hypothetical protein
LTRYRNLSVLRNTAVTRDDDPQGVLTSAARGHGIAVVKDQVSEHQEFLHIPDELAWFDLHSFPVHRGTIIDLGVVRIESQRIGKGGERKGKAQYENSKQAETVRGHER